MSDADARDAVVARLRAAGCVFAEDETRLLEEAARAADASVLDGLVARRVAGEPLETILGWVLFGGLRLAVAPGVFVPRVRTEALAAEAARLAIAASGASAPVVVDLCGGVGAIAAVVGERCRAAGVALGALVTTDIDPVASAVAARNLAPYAGEAHAGDLFAAVPEDLAGRIDVLAVNAPYVPTDAIATMPPEARDHEPRVALDGGADGLELHRRIAASAADWLAPGGSILIETSVAQAPRTSALLAAGGLEVRVEHDDDRDGTFVVGRLVVGRKAG
ncbi:putative protein N(5)-glutamine methyltransferase [Agromyces protaetiae]|uniref:Methyltransferase small domain-containing protein n=1 Tax=Agromyces protaetiae TaxID=2509455 RepID=A0A4P6FCF4_9MICO|nr:putative protein N(5)-glutamine methyltransferase [Agromyces protaetiae]QAY73544.1 putative protein N(5)-glutamine methyltransferase [Agromyces protaetiae]